jgi:hypothetical protein
MRCVGETSSFFRYRSGLFRLSAGFLCNGAGVLLSDSRSLGCSARPFLVPPTILGMLPLLLGAFSLPL